MPRLNGNSSHGSKPITWSSLTFSWIPHCWPQKQQCVFTRRSGSTAESMRWPDGYARSGPNVASSSGVSGGSTAIGSSLRRRRPQASLREGEHLAPTRRTDALIVAGGMLGPVVPVAELPLDRDQVVDVNGRRVRLPAAGADRRPALGAGVAVELDGELGGALEDMEELPERQPQQREDDRDGVSDGEELIGVALHPRVADRQQEPGGADREQQEQRQEVLLEILERRRPPVAQPPAQGEDHARDHEQRGPHEPVEEQVPDQRCVGERDGGDAEDEDLIARKVARHRPEIEPAEHEGERDGGGEQAAPHDQLVRQPTRPAAPPDEPVRQEHADEPTDEAPEALRQASSLQERLPPAPPVEPGGRALQPHRVSIAEAERGEQTREGVADEGGIDVPQVAGPREDADPQQPRRDQAPNDGAH